jgi:hypothetical protein
MDDFELEIKRDFLLEAKDLIQSVEIGRASCRERVSFVV